MSLWWLAPIALAVLGFWASRWEDKPLSENDLKDWEDEHGQDL